MKFDIFYYITILKQFIYWIAQTMIANDAVACNNWSYKWQCFIDTVYCKIPKNSAKNNKLFFFLVDFLQIYFTLHIRLNFRYIHIIMTTLFWFPWSQLSNFLCRLLAWSFGTLGDIQKKSGRSRDHEIYWLMWFICWSFQLYLRYNQQMQLKCIRSYLYFVMILPSRRYCPMEIIVVLQCQTIKYCI